MCGICGVHGPSVEDLQLTVGRMTQTLAHRGPDGEGIFIGEGVALGHRRLSIIDLSSTGAQPMTLGATTVVYNGESYNFLTLRAELQGLGRVFRGHSDTEVLLHAYEAWGIAGLERLEGIFAFALWDAGRRRLILMRDRLGRQTAVLRLARRTVDLRFGDQGGFRRRRRRTGRWTIRRSWNILWYGNAFEERTIYRAVRSLPPGGRLVVEDGRSRIETWWQVEEWLAPFSAAASRQEAAAAVREAVDAAVARQLVGDVPVGLFLSGGVDSSSIAASAAVAGGRRSDQLFRGIRLRSAESTNCRRHGAWRKALGLDHHELQVRGDALEEVICRAGADP